MALIFCGVAISRLSVIHSTGSWLLSLPVAALAVAVIGLLMERMFLRPLGFDPLRQVLLTVGFAFLFQQGALDIWGGDNMDINPPGALAAKRRHRRNVLSRSTGFS